MNSNVFDDDTIFLNQLKKKLFYIFFLLLALIIVLLYLVQKSHFYQNSIFYEDLVTAYIIVDKKYLDFIKDGKLCLDEETYDYSIKKIEEENDWYLVTIVFPYELNIDCKYYRLLLNEESILHYIIRIMKGE